MARYYNSKTHELDDKRIVKALYIASRMYEDGGIAEAYELLINVVKSIDEFNAYMRDPDD